MRRWDDSLWEPGGAVTEDESRVRAVDEELDAQVMETGGEVHVGATAARPRLHRRVEVVVDC